MDNPKPKDESPEKVKFANSLVAMYGSGSDTSEDDDSQLTVTPVVQPSEGSDQQDLPNDLEMQDRQSELSTPNPVTATSISEASDVETIGKCQTISEGSSKIQEVPVTDETATGAIVKTETDVRKAHSEESEICVPTSDHVEEGADSVVSGSHENNQMANAARKMNFQNFVDKRQDSTDIVQSKPDECVIKPGGSSVKTDIAKDLLQDLKEKGDSKSVKDIVDEIDTVLAQGALPSKIRDIQSNKSDGDVIQTSVETAVAAVNLAENMDVDPTSDVDVSTKKDSGCAVSSKVISDGVQGDQGMHVAGPATEQEPKDTIGTVDRMEVPDEDPITSIDTADTEEGKILDVAEVKIPEISSPSEERGTESFGAGEEKTAEATNISNEEISTKEYIPEVDDVGDLKIDDEPLKTSGKDTPETSDFGAERILESLKSAEEKILPSDSIAEISCAAETLEEASSKEKASIKSPKRDSEKVEANLPTESEEVDEELRSPDTTKHGDSIEFSAVDEKAVEESKPEIVKAIEEAAVKTEEAANPAIANEVEEPASEGVNEESAMVSEAVEEASDASFASCEELDKSDEIAQSDDIKFADATDKLDFEEKPLSAESPHRECPTVVEESNVQVDESVSQVPSTDEVMSPQGEKEGCVPVAVPVTVPVVVPVAVPVTEPVASPPSVMPSEEKPKASGDVEEKSDQSKTEVEVDRVAISEPSTAGVISESPKELKETNVVAEEPVAETRASKQVSVEAQVEEPGRTSAKQVEVLESSHEEKVSSPEVEDVSKEGAPDEETAGGASTHKKKEPAVRRLRQVRHPSAKAAEAAADAAFVAAVTPTRTNLKEAKIACAIANVTETSEVMSKELTPRQRKNRSSSAEPQPASEPEQTEQPADKPVSIKLKISKDAVKIVSNEPPDLTIAPVEAKRPKKDPSDLPVAKQPHYMKNLEVQIPQADVSIYEAAMSPGGTLRKHKRHKEGAASPSMTLSPITLKIAKDKSSENLCCIVPEEVRTASPVDSEGREKITLKISKDDGIVRSSVSPLVSPGERSEESRSEKAALKLAKEEAAALARNREGVPSPRSDDGENRLERITLKLAVGEKNSWSIKSADSDSALSPSSTDSGSTKIKPKISVVRMEELLETENLKSSKRASTGGKEADESFVLQIAPSKRPLEDAEMVPSKAVKVDEEVPAVSTVTDDMEILDEKPEVEEPVDQKPPIEEIILEDSSSMPADPAFVEKPPVQQPSGMDVDDDVVILTAKIVKKARGRPRKVRPLGEVCPTVGASPGAGRGAGRGAVPGDLIKRQSTEESMDHRPKRVCKGRERLPPKPTKPRGRYAHQLKLRQAEEAAAAAIAAAGGVLPTSTSVSVSIVPSTTATPTASPIPKKPSLTIVKIPKESPVKTPRAAPKPPHLKPKIIRPEAPQVFEEETRMSADISTCPTPTPAQSESSGPATAAQAAPAQQTSAQPEAKGGISFNSPLAAIDSTGILPRLVITPSTPVRSQTPALSTTGDESQSNSTTELTSKATGNKKGRMEVVDPDAKVEFTVDMIAEYMWPVDKPGVRGEIYMIQEQISQYLGVKSFKRKYPNLIRRPVEHEERQYLLDRKLVSEGLCDMGLTAVVNHEVLDVMVVDFPEKYEEYRKFTSEKSQRQLTSKQKGVFPLGRIEDSTSVSQRDAASFNVMLNRERREQRKCFFDLQAFSIQYPESRRKRMVPANIPKVGHYPVALVPGQYTDYYKKYTAAELRYFPLNTVLYGPLMPGEIRDLNQNGGSEGSQSDSSDSSSSDSESSNSGSSGSSGSDSSPDDSDDEMSNQIEKTESRDSVPEKETTPCKVCSGDRRKNKLGVPEPMITCAVCSSSGHPTCLDLTVDMVPHIRKYNWQCTDCKTCAQCKDPADEDKMLFCDMCDRGYHIYCVGLRKVPEGRWHCKECAVCSSCSARDPGGAPEQQQQQQQQQQQLATPNSTPNKNDLPLWQHEFKKGDKGSRVYVRTLCVPCSRLWKKGRYCRLCWKCYGNKPEEEGLINCSACDRWMHSDCCRLAGSVIDEKTSNFLCELCQQKGVRSPIKNFKTPVR